MLKTAALLNYWMRKRASEASALGSSGPSHVTVFAGNKTVSDSSFKGNTSSLRPGAETLRGNQSFFKAPDLKRLLNTTHYDRKETFTKQKFKGFKDKIDSIYETNRKNLINPKEILKDLTYKIKR